MVSVGLLGTYKAINKVHRTKEVNMKLIVCRNTTEKRKMKQLKQLLLLLVHLLQAGRKPIRAGN